MDCSPPGPFVHGISQARILEWVAISFSNNIIIYKVFRHHQSSLPKISSPKKKKTKILLQGPTQEHTLYLVVTCLCLLWFGIIPQLVFVYCDLDFFNQQGPAVQNRELCLMLGGSLDERRVGGEWIHVYVWLSPFAIHLKLSQHC